MFLSNIFSCRFLIIGILLSSSINLSAKVDGEQLFKQNCTACHSLGTSRLIGPGLEGVTEKYEKEWLFKWIRNSQALIQSGDERAISIYEEYDKVAMTAFDFSDEELTSLLDYIANPPVKEELLANKGSDENQGMNSSYQLILLFIVLLVVVFMLTSLKNSLKETLGQETETIAETFVNQYRLFTSNSLNILFVSLVGVVVVLRITFDTLMGIGVTTNYQPAQPIEFSHKVHAGMNGIDCNYCHSSARSSKHSGIPSANVCMNCHTYISEGALTGAKEIAKIYDAVGFDSNTRTYIEDYQEKPIEWIRIHNLPDHVYFNHSQHVTVGQLECQECHGAIEEMDVVKQHSELTMGWCIECHRETEVKMEGNDYYTSMHEKMKEKYAGEKITVDKIGGLECGKCHY